MRPPRRLRPNARFFVTIRCARAQYRLRPDPVRRNLMGFYLGRALERHEGVQVHAVVQMSNHLHIVVTDTRAELDRFMAAFLGPLAKALNRLDGTSGQVWQTRYRATETVDDDALLSRIVYTVLNPVAAGLVAHPGAWSGLLLWFGGRRSETFQRFRRRDYERALCAARGHQSQVDARAFVDQVTVSLSALDIRGLRQRLVRAVHVGTRAHARARQPKSVLGMRRVLRQPPFGAPQKPKVAPAPLCHASSPEAFLAFRDGWRDWVRHYRAASTAYRSGALDVLFPEHAFRPWIRPLAWSSQGSKDSLRAEDVSLSAACETARVPSKLPTRDAPVPD